jgi:predicted kinase
MKNCRTVHLIYGPTAAGKSTYATKLAAETNAVRFAIDDWMHALYAQDRPEKMDMPWVMTRVARCQSRIWSTCLQILATGTDVVLELGLLREKDRDQMKSTVEAAGYQVSFNFVDANLQVRKQRVLQRNEEKGATYSFNVTPTMFDAMERYFEPPTERELDRSHVVIPKENHHG